MVAANRARSASLTPITAARVSRLSPWPAAASRARATRLPSMYMAVFQEDDTTPSCVQPEVPKVRPKVWLPEVPFSVEACSDEKTPLGPPIDVMRPTKCYLLFTRCKKAPRAGASCDARRACSGCVVLALEGRAGAGQEGLGACRMTEVVRG